MNHNRWARWTALVSAIVAGLGLCGLGLGGAQAQAAPAGRASPAASQTWHVAASPGDGLAGYWKFDQVADGKTINSALLSNQTTLSGGASITTTITPSVTVPNFGSVQLDGLNDNAVVSDAAQLDVAPTSFSVAAWVRRTTINTYDAIYDSGTETNKWWIFIADNGSGKANRFGFGVRGITETYSTRAITDTNWHHLAVVKNGNGPSNLTFYVDGAASGIVTATNILTPTGTKRIGALLDSGLSSFFGGSLDEVRLYNRALSAVEVGRLAAGQGCVTDGTTWPTAFADLQCGVSAAHAGDQIWVAAGTYRPGTAVQASFNLFLNVDLFGGFTGTESSPAQRPAFDPNHPLTVLSGDAAENDVIANFGHYDDNACNVVKIGSLTFPDAVSATLDGLAIQEGNADAGARCNTLPSTPNGAGLASVSPNQLTLNNVVFQFNQAREFGGLGGQGGGLYHSAGQLILSGTRFFSNTAALGGGLMIGGGLVGSGRITITASSFVSNTASQGGAIDLRPNNGQTSLAVSGSHFTGNHAQDGGAVEDQILAGLLDLSFDTVDFTGNRAVGGDGGAVSSSALEPGLVRSRFSQTNFSHNFAEVDSGALSDSGGQLTIANSHFLSNTSQASSGGALEAQSVVTVTNSEFVSNTSRGTGGAVSVLGTLAMSGSSVSQNQVNDPGLFSDYTPVGGGVFVSGTAVITNTQFFSNTAFLQGLVMASNMAEGGGLAVTGDLTINGATLRGNSGSHGGAIYVLGTLAMSGSQVSLNQALDPRQASDFLPLGGGALVSGTAVITNSQFISNSAVIIGVEGSNLADGGGLAVTGNLALAGGDFRDNSAEHGGGLYAQGSAVIQRSLFQGNTAGSGGGVFADGTLRFLSNRLINNAALETLTNGSSQGGGLLLENAFNSDVSTNLFLDNHAATLDAGGAVCGGSPACGSALAADGFATSIANNTIVSHNPITVSAVVITGFTGLFNNIITSHTIGIQALGGAHFEDYNLFNGDALTITGVISASGHSRVADPRFVAPAQADYHLRLDSPAVDAGDNEFVKLFVTTDLAGGPRFVDVHAVPDTGAGGPPIVDIGAYETVADELFLPLLMR